MPYPFLALLVALGAAAALANPSAARAAIIIVNTDGAGEGFNDPDPRDPVGGNTAPTLGGQRLAVFEHAANLLENVISSPVDILVEASFDPLSCSDLSATLGQAGAKSSFFGFPGAPRENTFYPAALANKLAGSDRDPNDNDIFAQFNSAIGTTCNFPSVFYYGLDASGPTNEIDLVTVVLHELGHGLGFFTLVSLSGGTKPSNKDDAFMLFLEDHSTGKLYPDMDNGERVAASINTSNLHWVGESVVAASGGLTSGRHDPSGHVQMFAPDPRQSGSSVSHWDSALVPNELMEPQYTGALHDIGLMLELFNDIGWETLGTTTTNPSPTTTTLATTTTAGPTTTSSTTTTTLVGTTTTSTGGTSSSTVQQPTTTIGGLPTCGDVSGDENITASDALGVLRAAVGSTTCELCVCDVNSSGTLTAPDALAVLRNAVGVGSPLNCPSC